MLGILYYEQADERMEIIQERMENIIASIWGQLLITIPNAPYTPSIFLSIRNNYFGKRILLKQALIHVHFSKFGSK